MPRLLEGEAPAGLGEAVMRLIEARGYTVTTVPDTAALLGANGRTRFSSRLVEIRTDMDDAAMVKTILHEAAHVCLHDPETNPDGVKLPRGHKEVEAESVAFIVARAHGIAHRRLQFRLRRRLGRRGPRHRAGQDRAAGRGVREGDHR